MSTSKTAVVTGSTSGIGLGIARALAATGADIVLNGIESPEEVQELVKQIQDDHGVKVIYCNANLMQAEGVNKLISDAMETFGKVDILVNNAGIQFVSPVEDFPDEKWEAIIALNLSSAFYACKATR